MMIVLVDATKGMEPRLDEAALEQLRRLGVTDIELLRDERRLGLVLEGWSFDPGRSRDAVVAAVGAPETARTLLPLVHMAVAPASEGDPS